ncbi:MAG: PD40 domain-containing protein [Bacteroidales bacterium]|nr:PD40 domain-containing protein [Bacteroidales bacterium]MBN2821239.1 PD40 domain-containing protein [Bacteroidales bacterium]
MRSLLLILAFVPVICLAQSKKISQANNYYDKGRYNEALAIYLQLEVNLTDIIEIAQNNLKIASCYYCLHQPFKAVDYFKKTASSGYVLEPEQLIEYSNALIESGNYKDAQQLLQSSDAGLFMEDILLQKCTYALSNNTTDKSVSITLLNDLPANSSFGISLYRDILFFVLNLSEQRTQNLTFAYSGRQDELLGNLANIEFPLNTNSPSFDIKNNILYFSASAVDLVAYSNSGRNRKKIGAGDVNNLFIYTANLSQEKTSPAALPFNHIDFSCTHPCISKDGKTLYFSSNMLGGYGGFDIYYTIKTESGWDLPQNMGPTVNSFLNEGYPFLTDDFLYFSSDGKPGYGGLDVFRLNFETTQIENLGLPVNSSFDDFYFIQATEKEGFFVSNRSGNHAADQIYRYYIGK